MKVGKRALADTILDAIVVFVLFCSASPAARMENLTTRESPTPDSMTRGPSQRAQEFTESVIRQMTRLSEKYGAVNLAQGFPDFDPPSIVKQAGARAIREGYNQYSTPYGIVKLRHAIARKLHLYNHIDYDPDTELTVTCGTTEAMMASLLALLDHGDEVVIFEPFYENYGPDAILSGAR